MRELTLQAAGADRSTSRALTVRCEDADSAAEHRPQLSFPPRTAATVPARRLDDETTRRLADSIARLDVRLDQLISEGRAASNEIERKVNAVDRMLSR